MRLEKWVALSALAVLGGCQSTAGPASFAVPAGVQRMIHQDYSLNEDCTPLGEIDVRIVSPPQHGVVEVRSGMVHPTFPASNPHSVCNTRSVPGKQTWYTPAAGYAGSDSVTIDAIYPSGHEQTYVISINVQ